MIGINEPRWVIRVPIPPPLVMLPEKYVQDQVAVMKYVKAKTTIPIPYIIAHGTAAQNVVGFGPFIITKYVDGDNLGEKLYD
jgi:hypothetical protein